MHRFLKNWILSTITPLCTFKKYQIIYLIDISAVSVFKIFWRYMVLTSRFFLHIITRNVHRQCAKQPMRKKTHWFCWPLVFIMEVGVIRSPRKVEYNDWLKKFFAFLKSIFINRYGCKNWRQKTNLQFHWFLP